jgi:hypothetical protein
MISKSRYALSVATVLLLWSTAPAAACPFCSPVSQTFTEEIASMDAVVIARLTVPPAGKLGAAAGQEVPKATFEITEVLKGKDHLRTTKSIQTVFFSAGQAGDLFLIVGVDPPAISWSTPLKVSGRAVAYLRSLDGLPATGAERLRFFQNHLEDEDDMLARDAYDEFARTPYGTIKELKPYLDHDRIVAWIKNSQIPVNRRRLYLVLLSVCGDERDAAMLERMIRSEDRQSRAGLDAMIGCYLTLIGPKGMPLIEDLFLKNQQAEYADTYSAIMALRFHGTETDVIPQERILEGLRYMLDRPQLADLVIPDLARWQDWTQIDRLVRLFKEADEKSSWVRVPVVNYLRACPKPEAKEYIKDLEKIDPDAVKRASVFLPFGPSAPSSDGPS